MKKHIFLALIVLISQLVVAAAASAAESKPRTLDSLIQSHQAVIAAIQPVKATNSPCFEPMLSYVELKVDSSSQPEQPKANQAQEASEFSDFKALMQQSGDSSTF